MYGLYLVVHIQSLTPVALCTLYTKALALQVSSHQDWLPMLRSGVKIFMLIMMAVLLLYLYSMYQDARMLAAIFYLADVYSHIVM